jgi:hypothetical protein
MVDLAHVIGRRALPAGKSIEALAIRTPNAIWIRIG